MATVNYSNYFSKIAYWGGLLYIASLILEGLIRYLLYLFRVEYLLYFRDIFLLSCILCYTISATRDFKINRFYLIILFIFIFHSIVFLFYVGNIPMLLFAWKIYLPLFFGLLFGQIFFSNLRSTVRIFMIFFISAALAVFLNYFITFPWEGLDYSLFGFDIEAVRFWTAWEFKRVSGLARTSYDAAIQLLLLAIFLICYLNNKSLKIILWLLAGSAILLTTSKGIILAYCLISLLLISYRYINDYFNIYQKVLYLVLAIAIILPLLPISNIEIGDNSLLLVSFYDRVINSWPDVFKLVREHGNLLLGRGLGGMGTGQLFYETKLYNPGDNIFLMVYANFGIFGVGYLLYLAIIGQSLELNSELFYYLFLIFYFTYGITTSCTENAMLNMFLGIYIAYVGNCELRQVDYGGLT